MPKRAQLEEFMRRMEPGSVAIIPSAREVTRSHDTTYSFRQSSDFYYLTGLDEPDAIAVVRPGYEHGAYTLFVRPRDAEKEAWDGPRAGVEGATADYGADAAHPIAEFDSKLDELLTGATNLYYRLGIDRDLDDKVIRRLAALRGMTRKAVVAPVTITDLAAIAHEMRRVKSDEEIGIIERAAEITAEAHREAMRRTKPGMKEYEVAAIIEYTFRKHGAAAPSYGSIVGAGNNATVLHYVRNDADVYDGDLLLVDAGAEYQGYAADITRAYPANGTFTRAQRDIYELVLQAEEMCVAGVRPGVTMDELYKLSVEILTAGLVRLGILQGEPSKLIEEEAFKKFYMHKLGHFLGMDVHDVGLYYEGGKARPLEQGMIVTIEPGLYITKDAENVPDEYRGIGVRIEDDVLVTPDGNRVLTGGVPKRVDEIEALMRG